MLVTSPLILLKCTSPKPYSTGSLRLERRELKEKEVYGAQRCLNPFSHAGCLYLLGLRIHFNSKKEPLAESTSCFIS